MKPILLFLFGLGLSLAAQDLKVFYRQAEGGISKIYLVAVNPKAKITGQPCNGGERCFDPQVLLLLPKPKHARRPIELKHVLVCGSEGSSPKCPSLKTLDGKAFKLPFIEIDTTYEKKSDEEMKDFSPEERAAEKKAKPTDAEDALVAYPGELEEGRRFEAILTLKNVWVDGVPTTQTVTLPATLQLTFDPDESVYEDGVVKFRAVYVPKEYEAAVGTKEFWKLNGAAEGVKLEGVSAFDAKSRALNFYLPNLVRQPDTALSFEPVLADARTKMASQQSFRYLRPTLMGGAAPGVSTNPKPGRTRPFKTNGPVVSQDLPIFIRGAYTNNLGQKTGQHVFNLEASFAADNDFSLPPVWQSALNQVLVTPHVKIDMNTARTLDNPNSIVWSLPMAFRHYFPGHFTGTSTGYKSPWLRTISVQTGLEGEHSLYKQSQNLLIPLKGTVKYSTRPGAWQFSFDAKGGAEGGHVFSQTIDKLVLEDPNTTVSPATFSRTLTVDNRNIRRMTAEATLKLSQGKKVSIEGLWQYRKLFRPEQIITEREVAGNFSPDAGQAFFGMGSVRDTYKVLETGFAKGVRRYGEISLKYAITETISVDLAYKRGYKPPTFQVVNFVSVGFSYSLGKPKQ